MSEKNNPNAFVRKLDPDLRIEWERAQVAYEDKIANAERIRRNNLERIRREQERRAGGAAEAGK
jgi:hypothetical protein